MAFENEIAVNIVANIQKLSQGLNNATNGLKKWGASTKRWVSQNKLLITASLTAVAVGLFKVTRAASDLEETQAKFNTVFRGGIALAEENSQILQDSFLMSETASKANLAAIQDTLVPMGLMRDAASEISFEVVKLAADLGSFNNLPTEMVMRDIQSALVGNFETMKKYGVVLRATDVENRILNTGIRKTRDEITNADKVMQAYQLILEGSADAQGDVARTSESFANQMKLLSANFTDFMTLIGQFTIGPGKDLVTLLNKLVEIQTESIKAISEANEENNGFFNTLKSVGLQAITELSEAMKNQGLIFNLNAQALGRLNNNIQKNIVLANTNAAAVVQGEAEKQEAIVATGEIFQEDVILRTQTDLIASDERIQQAIKEGAERNAVSIKSKELSIFNTKEWTSFAKDATGQMFDSFGSGMADMIFEGRKFKDVMSSIFKSMARAFVAQVAKMIAKWLAFMALKAAFGGGVGAFLQHGGIIGEPTLMRGLISGQTAIAGEAGPEMIVPAKGAARGGIRPFAPGQAPSVGGGGDGSGMNLTININGQFLESTPSKWQLLVREKIVPEIQRWTMISPTGPFIRKRGATR